MHHEQYKTPQKVTNAPDLWIVTMRFFVFISFGCHVGVNLGVALAKQDARLAVKMHLRTSSRRAATSRFDKSGMGHFIRQAAEDAPDFVDTRHTVRSVMVLTGTVKLRQIPHDKR